MRAILLRIVDYVISNLAMVEVRSCPSPPFGVDFRGSRWDGTIENQPSEIENHLNTFPCRLSHRCKVHPEKEGRGKGRDRENDNASTSFLGLYLYLYLFYVLYGPCPSPRGPKETFI